jgi:hypothetical protein
VALAGPPGGKPHSYPLNQRRNGKVLSSLTARGGGLPIEVKNQAELLDAEDRRGDFGGMNEAGCVITREALKRFDTEGSPRLNNICVELTGLGLDPNPVGSILAKDRSI